MRNNGAAGRWLERILPEVLFYFIQGKGVEDMATVYALLIIKGKKAYTDVPAKLKAQVREILYDMEVPELAAE